MSGSKNRIRKFSRLMAMLFAVQIMTGGFCLLTEEAHAMPQSAAQTMHVAGHCDKALHAAADQEHGSDHLGSCYHCDQPDALSGASVPSIAPDKLVLSDVISLPVVQLSGSEVTGLYSTRTPTGPPRSSSLLYTTTQRIRV